MIEVAVMTSASFCIQLLDALKRTEDAFTIFVLELDTLEEILKQNTKQRASQVKENNGFKNREGFYPTKANHMSYTVTSQVRFCVSSLVIY